MAGIIKKTEQTLGMGGPKEGDKQSGEHKPEQKGEHKPACRGEHKPACQGDEQKEGGGFIKKTQQTLGMGGPKEGDKLFGEHKPEQKGEHKPACRGEHKPACQGDEQKEGGGFMDKVKGKIPGVGCQEEKGEEKKKDLLG